MNIYFSFNVILDNDSMVALNDLRERKNLSRFCGRATDL